MTKGRFRGSSLIAVVTTVCFAMASCSSYYRFHPLAYPKPSQMRHSRILPGTHIGIGVRSYHTAERIHSLFGHRGLWRQHVIPVLLVVKEGGHSTASIDPNSIFLTVMKQRFQSISPAETFDLAWEESVPYQNVKKTVYYTGLILFTIVTLGLGSMIWVLPSPFVQPSPSQDPFGRDLAYKAFPIGAKIISGGRVAGLLYFNTPFNEKMIRNASLSFQIIEKRIGKKTPERVIYASIPLKATEKSKVNPLYEMLHGFF